MDHYDTDLVAWLTYRAMHEGYERARGEEELDAASERVIDRIWRNWWQKTISQQDRQIAKMADLSVSDWEEA